MGENPLTGGKEAYDFKGNLLRTTRRLMKGYKIIPDWSDDEMPLSDEVFMNSTTFDALNRPTALTTPDRSVMRPRYSEANLLDSLDVNLRGEQSGGAPKWTPFVTNIDYNARGQRTLVRYGNGAETRYHYDPDTFRLVHLYTRRGPTFAQDCGGSPPPPRFPAPEKPPRDTPCGLQNLRYTYDPVGNITHIRDDAQQTVFFDNTVVNPESQFTYDPIYRLIEATGREHIGQTGRPWTTYNDAGRVKLPHPRDGRAMRRYTELYEYDEVGNFLNLIHKANNGAVAWKRSHGYEEPSLIAEDSGNGIKNNRITTTTISGEGLPGTVERYSHDEHGNMTKMPQLEAMEWDFKDQLFMSRRQAVDTDDADGAQRQGERTYYVYGASGQRVRKVTERANGKLKDERIYVGGFEVYREYGGNGTAVTLERETLHVMDDKERVALVETKTFENGNPFNTPALRYQLGNHLGSTSLELDGTGGLIAYEEYTPYGSTAYQAGRSAAEVSLKRYRYSGKERDEENGCTYHGARYYAPWLGRWTSCDTPSVSKCEQNLYASVCVCAWCSHQICRCKRTRSSTSERHQNHRRTRKKLSRP
jgi:RHS repeat-associated protein